MASQSENPPMQSSAVEITRVLLWKGMTGSLARNMESRGWPPPPRCRRGTRPRRTRRGGMPRGAARPRGGEAGSESVVELLQQGVEQPVPQDVEAVPDGVRDAGPVAPERLPLGGRPLAVVGVVHGLVEHRVDERCVDGPEERHTLLVLLGLAGDDVVLEDVPEAEGHLGDGLLGGELGVAGGGGEDGGDQAQRHVPTLPAGARPVDQQAVGDSPKVMNRLSTGRHISKLPSDMYWCSTESRGRIF